MERIPFLGATLTRLSLDALADRTGPLQPATARRIVARLNAERTRDPELDAAAPATARQPLPGELLALSLLHEAAHLAIVEAARRHPSAALAAAVPAVREALGTREADALLRDFAAAFPGVEKPADLRLEDLLLVHLANANPAAAPLVELVDEGVLPAETLAAAIQALERHQASLPIDDADGTGGALSLLELLREPARQSPDSLTGQLRYVREHWGWLLGDALAEIADRLDIAIGVLTEEEHGLHVRFGAGAGGGGAGGGGGEAPVVRRRRGRGRAVLDRPRLDAPPRPARQEHVRLARPALEAARPRDPDARRHPGRGAGRDRRPRDHRALADRAVAALEGVRDDQALARQRRRRRLGLFARRLPDRRRPRRRGRPGRPPDPSLGPWDPDGERHGPEPHGPRLALGHRASGAVHRGRRAALPFVPVRGPQPRRRSTDRDPDRGPLLGRQRRRRRLRAARHRDRRAALPLPRQRRHELSLERHRPARLREGRGPRGGHPDDPRRRPALPGHPVRRRDGPRQEARRAALVSGAWCRRRDPVTGRACDPEGRLRCADARRVLARGRRPGRRRGARHAPPGRGVLAPRGLLRPDPRDAPGLQQRVHAHDPGRGQRGLPQGDPRNGRVRPGDPRAVRQLPDEPGRGDRDRAVRDRRQVLRGRDPARDPARAADGRPRPGGGLHREVRDGVPAGTARGDPEPGI